MAVRKKPSPKKETKTGRKRGRPAAKIDVKKSLPAVFDKPAFDFDPKDGWEKMDREEAISHLAEKYGKTVADVIADCYDEDPNVRTEDIIVMFKQRCNIDVDRQYVYTGKNRWKRNRETEHLRKGAAVAAVSGSSSDLIPDVVRLISEHGIKQVKETIENLESIADMMRQK